LVVGDHAEAFPRVGVAEPVVCGVEEPLEHHWVRHAGEVPLRVPVRSGGWQLAGGAVVGLVVGGCSKVPSRWDMAARTTSARSHVGASRRGVRHCGAAQAEGGPQPGNRTPPPRLERLPSRQRSRCVARRHARPVIVPSTPVESADRSVVGVEVLKGPQRPLGRGPGRQQRVRRVPVLARSTAAGEAHRGW
jgi:hypothetical protein